VRQTSKLEKTFDQVGCKNICEWFNKGAYYPRCPQSYEEVAMSESFDPEYVKALTRRRKPVLRGPSEPPIHEPKDQILGVPIEEREEYEYAHDFENRGYVLPFEHYTGPGNSLNRGEPVTKTDRISQVHDLAYSHAKWLYDNGEFNEKQYNDAIDLADKDYVKSTSSLGTLDAVVGHDGIQFKRLAEKLFGRIYPGINDNERELHLQHFERNNDNYSASRPEEHAKLTELKQKISEWNNPEFSEEQTFSGVVTGEGDGHNNMTVPGQKRAGEPLPSSSKVRVSEGNSGQAAAQPTDTSLNSEVNMLTGTGKEQASGGASSDGTPVYTIDRPLSIFGAKTSTYKKVHKFMTFGLADAIISNGTVADGNRFLTSYLAEVPWHIPALYLNQSEFDLLPDGSRVVELNIKVYYRGSTIQFETAASSTQLATLNQINEIAVAHGLNRTGWGSNVSYASFNATQSMIPTQINPPKYSLDAVGPITYKGMVRDYYGSNNLSTNFAGDIPKHQTGRQTFLYNYWATTQRDGNTVTTAANRMYGGWPCLAEKIKQMDGKTVVNQCVAESTYKPRFAPIKNPHRMRSHGLPFPIQNETINVPVGGNLVNGRTAIVKNNNTAPATSIGIPNTSTEKTEQYSNYTDGVVNVPTFSIYTPIEKSQIGRSGMWGEQDPHIQPSLHIGVQPVPAQTTSALLLGDGVFNQWTDTRAYWEVVAEMKVVEHTPTAWPYAAQANVPIGEVVMWVPDADRPPMYIDPSNDGATIAGLYPTIAAPITATS